MKHFLHFTALLLCSPAFAAPLKAVATFSVLADIVREIGGDEVAVSSLIAPGKDPHDFAPGAKDLALLKSADAVFLVGLGFEPWFENAAKAAGGKNPPVHAGATADTVKTGGHTDPHVWLDFENARRMGTTIETTLAGLRPEKKADFAARAERFRAALTKLEEGFKKDFAALPAERRKIVIAHEGFGYLSRAFGIEFISPTYVGHGHELTPKRLAKFFKTVKDERLKSYFEIYGHPSAITRDLARDQGLTQAGILFGDSLGEAGSTADSFLEMQEHNLRAILEHLRKTPQN